MRMRGDGINGKTRAELSGKKKKSKKAKNAAIGGSLSYCAAFYTSHGAKGLKLSRSSRAICRFKDRRFMPGCSVEFPARQIAALRARSRDVIASRHPEFYKSTRDN
jgi:hypothetical protein